MLFLIRGPTQPDIGFVEEREPSALNIFKIPQKAKEVLVEPVLLLIDKNNVLVIEVFGVQELHASLPGKEAPTKIKSFDVHELGAGKDCANEPDDAKTRKTMKQTCKGKKK
jgi:hypothetical protein